MKVLCRCLVVVSGIFGLSSYSNGQLHLAESQSRHLVSGLDRASVTLYTGHGFAAI